MPNTKSDYHNRLSITILSCQKFSDLWANNLSLLEANWPNHPNVRLISDGIGLYEPAEPDGLVVINGNMSSRLIRAIETAETQYVLLTLDDYFLKRPVKESTIYSLLDYMSKENIDYCRFFRKKDVKGKYSEPGRHKKLPLQEAYEANFYPGLWKRTSLLAVIKNGEDIWKTEVRLTKRMRESGLKGIAVYDKTVFPFVDIVRKGKYLRSGYRFIKRNNLFCSDRSIRTVKETLSLFIQTVASDHFPKPLQEHLKRRARKKGKVFFSDCEYTDD